MRVRQEQYQTVCSLAPLHFLQFTTSSKVACRAEEKARDRIKAASCSPEICPESSEFVVGIFSVTLSKITGCKLSSISLRSTGDFNSVCRPMRSEESSTSANQRGGGSLTVANLSLTGDKVSVTARSLHTTTQNISVCASSNSWPYFWISQMSPSK